MIKKGILLKINSLQEVEKSENLEKSKIDSSDEEYIFKYKKQNNKNNEDNYIIKIYSLNNNSLKENKNFPDLRNFEKEEEVIRPIKNYLEKIKEEKNLNIIFNNNNFSMEFIILKRILSLLSVKNFFKNITTDNIKYGINAMKKIKNEDIYNISDPLKDLKYLNQETYNL